MRDSKRNAGLSGLRGRLSSEFARILDCCDWRSEDLSKGHSLTRHRALHIEPLEVRHLLSAVNWFEVVATDITDHASAAVWTAANTIASGTSVAGDTTSPSSNVYDWIVQFDTSSLSGISSVAETLSLITGHGVEFDVIEGLGLTGMILVRSSGASLQQVQSCFESITVVANYEQDAFHEASTGTNSATTSAYAIDMIDSSAASSITAGSTSVVVAVIDTGVDYNNVVLSKYIWTNPGEIAGNGIDDDGNGFVDDVHGYDFANHDGNPMDDNGHGSHVSGIITSVANCSVMALKFLNSDGSGYLSDAIQAVNYATMMRSKYGVNVRVDNNSWGGSSFSAALKASIDAANYAGILFVAAAGNDGTNNDKTVSYPANYTSDNVISVAACTQSGTLAGFSNYGATTVDIAAPGVSILSTTLENTYSYMSGTSMATPYVSGVAALAWSTYTDATVAQVKNAIISGAETSSALSGKVVAGGIVNAYNTLKSLASTAVAKPVIAALSPSTASVMARASITLTAAGITDTAGTVRSVDFYRDSNGNGQYDADDTLVGSVSSISNGNASITFSTAGFANGSYRYFAVAVDSRKQSSAAVAIVFTVLSSDDHGDNASSATLIDSPSSTAGNLAVSGDKDWFRFTATAGRTYVFTVQLGTLSDSVLYLYNRTGTAVLVSNDDYGDTSASQIIWTAATSGTYYLVVAGYGNIAKGTYSLKAGAENKTPSLASIADQKMTGTQTSVSVNLKGTDADGDPLTYSATVYSIDAVQQKAYDLDRSLGLYKSSKGFQTNLHGKKEKYLQGNNNTLYYILPSGALYRWRGTIAKSTLVANLGSAYYATPVLLYNAKAPQAALVDSSKVGVSFLGDTITLTRNTTYTGNFSVQVAVSDGFAAAIRTFSVSLSSASSFKGTTQDKVTTSNIQTSNDIPSGFSQVSSDEAMTRLAIEATNASHSISINSTNVFATNGRLSESAFARDDAFADFAAKRPTSSQSSSVAAKEESRVRSNSLVFTARLPSTWGALQGVDGSATRSSLRALLEPMAAEALLSSRTTEAQAVDVFFDNLTALLDDVT